MIYRDELIPGNLYNYFSDRYSWYIFSSYNATVNKTILLVNNDWLIYIGMKDYFYMFLSKHGMVYETDAGGLLEFLNNCI